MMKCCILFTLVLIMGCCVKPPAASQGIERIEFGSAGGFTGAKTTYALEAGGQVLKSNKDVFVELKTLNKAKVKSILRNASDLQTYQYNAPGNIYSFIRIKTSSSETSMVWVFGDEQVDKRVVALYSELMELVR